MGLQDTTTIDIAMKPPSGRGLDLIIFDSGEISGELRRYQLVLEKLGAYVEYVASGQYNERPPVDAGPALLFATVSRWPGTTWAGC